MSSTDEKVGYSPKSKQEQYTPESASAEVVGAIRMIEGRWKMTILFHLFDKGVLRFSELERAIPNVTQKMLIQQLRQLEKDEIVTRRVYPQVPPKVEYQLTTIGQELCPALDAILYWTEQRKVQRKLNQH
jgi:DNA-binding HxlR family transcriptional regulator